ncbi:NAD(P)-dependent oxidoreductase [Bdellovibrio sp. qaytius]|nr:NAD(P)-dependent oxidoreductase [Bdellovibrio sp. qaytius]
MKNSHILITGASSGIGEQLSYLLAKEKKSLVLLARREDRLKKVQKQCLKLGAADVQIFSCDVSDKKSVLLASKKIKANKKISVGSLVNNAGLAAGTELVQDAKTKDWDQMIDTNVKGLLWLTREFFESIILHQGHIVNLGSVAGRLVYEGGAVYCASKFAVRALSEGFRMDLKGTGVRVTNIEPGMVNSEFSLVRLGNQQKADAIYSEMLPLSPIDIAQNILWCLSQPAHVNIQELVIYPTDQASVGQVVRGGKSVKNLKSKNKK